MLVPGRVSAERYRLPMDVDTAGHPSQGPDPLTEIGGFGELLRSLEVGGTEAETLARITALEELKATIASAQAREAVAFERLRVERDRLNRVPARDCGVRAGDEVGLAKRVSPGSGRKFLSTARTVVTGLPNTFKALATGSISEDKARIMVEETAVLGDADRRRVDSRMKRSLGPAGLRSLRTEARALSAEMDAEAAAKRAAKAASNRRVSLTPLEDGMGRISAILPLPQAVAAFESLRRAAEATVAGGAANGRSRAQVLADTVVERLSGRPSASAVPAEVHLVVEAESLLSDGLVPAWLPGFGPLPAKTAREFVTANEARVLISRLFTRPEDGHSWGWRHGAGNSPAGCARCSSSATMCAELPGAMRPSGTPTTPNPMPGEDRPSGTTVRDCARRATSRRSTPAGSTTPRQKGSRSPRRAAAPTR